MFGYDHGRFFCLYTKGQENLTHCALCTWKVHSVTRCVILNTFLYIFTKVLCMGVCWFLTYFLFLFDPQLDHTSCPLQVPATAAFICNSSPNLHFLGPGPTVEKALERRGLMTLKWEFHGIWQNNYGNRSFHCFNFLLKNLTIIKEKNYLAVLFHRILRNVNLAMQNYQLFGDIFPIKTATESASEWCSSRWRWHCVLVYEYMT